MERKVWIDNLRWVTVVLVLVYHVLYLFNAEGTFGGIGGFAPVQYQDVVLYVLYPWFMLLLFVVAGMSSRYALEGLEAKLGDRRAAHRRFVRQRTLKLLVPSTVGLFVYHWMTGWLNMTATGGYLPEGLPALVRYFIFALTGIGPLWFVQDLWVFSLLLVVVRLLDRRDRAYALCGRLGGLSAITVTVVLMALAALFWGVAQVYVRPEQTEGSLAGLLNLYRPLFYLVGFLTGYFVLSHEKVTDALASQRWALLLIGVTCAVVFTVTNFGADYTMLSAARLTNIFAWWAVLAMLGCFKAWAGRMSAFGRYMTRSSYGIYIVHYLPLLFLAWTLKNHTALPAWAVYAVMLVAAFPVSVAIYETLRRIPLVRWAVLGMKASPQPSPRGEGAASGGN